MLSIEPNSLLNLVAPIATALLLVTLVSLMWRRRRGRPQRRAADSTLDTVQAWVPQAVRVMTLPERKAFELLRRALPRNYMVLAQVPLARFISVPTEHAYADWLHKVGRLCPDLLVCDASSRIIAVVEIGSPEAGSASRKRRERVHRVVQAAGIPVHVWNDNDLPSVTAARSLFKRDATDEAAGEWKQPSQLGHLGQEMLPVPDMHEMLAEGDDAFAHDPLQEPVASGFFDEIEAHHAARGARA